MVLYSMTKALNWWSHWTLIYTLNNSEKNTISSVCHGPTMFFAFVCLKYQFRIICGFFSNKRNGFRVFCTSTPCILKCGQPIANRMNGEDRGRPNKYFIFYMYIQKNTVNWVLRLSMTVSPTFWWKCATYCLAKCNHVTRALIC